MTRFRAKFAIVLLCLSTHMKDMFTFFLFHFVYSSFYRTSEIDISWYICLCTKNCPSFHIRSFFWVASWSRIAFSKWPNFIIINCRKKFHVLRGKLDEINLCRILIHRKVQFLWTLSNLHYVLYGFRCCFFLNSLPFVNVVLVLEFTLSDNCI